MIETGYLQVLAAAALALLAFVLAKIKSIPVEKEIAYGSVRAFVQLIAVGYALEFIFKLDSIWLISLAVAIMIVVASYTASQRLPKSKRPFMASLIAITAGSVITLVLMLLLDIIKVEARYIIPLSGMIISNSMNGGAVAFDRIGSDLKSNRLAVETSLALGKNWREASRKFYRTAIRAGMISILNFLKTVGIVALPGAMTGMILAGASPLEAVQLQIIVMYMLVGAGAFSGLTATFLTYRQFFSRAHQLILPAQ